MRIVLVFMVALFSTTCVAQSIGSSRVISGTVTDEFGVTSPGISVMVKGQMKGTITDANGKFTIQAKTGETLVFTYSGYSSKEITIGAKQSELSVVLQGMETSLHGWCCTDHPSPDGPHCDKDKAKLAREFECKSFVPDN